MNRYVIEFEAKAGKGDEAIKLFQEMKQYFLDRHQKTLDIFYQAFGKPGSFQVAMDFDNLSQLESMAAALRRDPEYKALADRARDLFTDDSFYTTVYYRL
ncbi:MAG: hypothetical protein OWU33_02525 [Firmicutes bacterium]|jgi:hypothetical protein|nr:hypothetical protein [Bacillota bacterium]